MVTTTRRVATATALAALSGISSLTAACGTGTPADQEAIAPWTQTIAPISDVSTAAKRAVLASGSGVVVVKPLTAAVFAVGDANPNMSDNAWIEMIDEARKLTTDAFAFGWRLTITGYADSTGSAARNAFLSGERARRVAPLFAAATGFPLDHIHAASGGVAADGTTNPTNARRIELVFVHP